MLPVHAVSLPLDLEGQENGKLNPAVLNNCGIRSFLMHHTACRALKAMNAAIEIEIGVAVDSTGTYRTYQQQVTLFNQRYTTTPIPGRPTKTWNGTTYWQKPGTAMAAVPGTSNHGLGLAIDYAEDAPNIVPVSAKFVDWLVANAWEYGFSAEAQSENWHWRYFAGDQVPVAVLEYEKHDKPPVPPTPPVGDNDVTVLAVPVRIYDSRNSGPLEGNKPRFIPVPAPPENARGVVVNLTIVPTGAPGFLAAWGDGDYPGTSDVNFSSTTVVCNGSLVPLTASDGINVMGNVPCHVIIDLKGWSA